MKVLVSCAKADFGEKLDLALVDIAAFLAPKEGVRVVSCASINWTQVRTAERGWSGAYKWSAKAHDAVVLLETESGCLSRGVFDIAREFKALGKPVGVWRDGKIVRVSDLRLTSEDDWKDRYGVAVVEGAQHDK